MQHCHWAAEAYQTSEISNTTYNFVLTQGAQKLSAKVELQSK